MNKNSIDVEHLAELARIKLTASERERFSGELEKVLTYVDQLRGIDTEGVPETAQVTGLTNVFRKMSNVDGQELNVELLRVHREELLAAAPETQDGFVKIPAIFSEE